MMHQEHFKVEPEEKEERGSGRSQNVVHTLPRSMASVPRFLTGPLERLDASAGTTQLLVVTADADTAVALAEAVLRMTGPAGIELIPVTSARRASRLMAGRPVLAIAGAPRDLRDLVRGSHIKLDSIKSVVLAWADEILAGDSDDIEALEAIMSELPKESARIVVTSRSEGRVNAFAERYLRRALREVESDDAAGAAVPLNYVTVSATSRGTSLRRLLDDLDPPSAAIVVNSDESEAEASRTLKLLGYGKDSSSVQITRGDVAPSTNAVIFFEPPATRAVLAAASAAGAVTIVTLVEPRELDEVKRISGNQAKPFTLSAPGNAARERDVAIRRELTYALESGVASRELLALEPLLDRFDGIEIAAAALRMLEKERGLRQLAQAEVRQAQAAPREERPSFDRSARPDRGERPDRGGRPDRGDRGDRGARPGGDRPRGAADRKPFERPRGAPGRGAPDRGSDSRPPRKFSDRPRRDRP
jgi:ATP-dependent RNA helicase DeaD